VCIIGIVILRVQSEMKRSEYWNVMWRKWRGFESGQVKVIASALHYKLRLLYLKTGEEMMMMMMMMMMILIIVTIITHCHHCYSAFV
jgi:hypothetical protein